MLFIIGRYKDKGQKGYRILDTETKQYKDIPEKLIINTGIKLENAEVVNGKLKGTAGDLRRYGELGVSEAMVILEAYNQGGNNMYYRITFTDGLLYLLKAHDMENFLKENPELKVANGKIKETKYGHLSLGAIKGSFNIVYIKHRMDAVPKSLEDKVIELLKTNKKEDIKNWIEKFTPITEDIRFIIWSNHNDKFRLTNNLGDNLLNMFSASYINMIRETIREQQGNEKEGLLITYYKPI